MAPKKRSKIQEDETAAAKPVPASSRATRRSPRLAANSKADLTVEEPVVKLPKRKKAKRAPKENGKAEEVENEGEDLDAASEKLGVEAKNRAVVIEHCKQCQSFKKRAIEVQNGLEKGVPGITVLLNPDKSHSEVEVLEGNLEFATLGLGFSADSRAKPRRGCFEIRSEDGEKFISLLDMKRPFTRMKELDMEEVISDIIEKIKG